MQLETFINDNRLKVAFTLVLVWLSAIWHFGTLNSFLYPLLATVLVIIFDLSITFVRDHKLYLPSASLVTGLLIGLIIPPTIPIWIIILATLVSSLSKQFIRVGIRQHIFNPAAIGIVAVNLFFSTPVAWWGVSWSKWPLIILIPLMLRILWKLKRIFLPISFLLAYFLYIFLIQKSADIAFQVIIDSSVLLFALVMLPEPITSLATGQFKWLFGTLVSIFAIGLTQLGILNEVFLPALLISNLVGFLFLRFGKTFAKTPETKQG